LGSATVPIINLQGVKGRNKKEGIKGRNKKEGIKGRNKKGRG
jgi:hypothetical protein